MPFAAVMAFEERGCGNIRLAEEEAMIARTYLAEKMDGFANGKLSEGDAPARDLEQ